MAYNKDNLFLMTPPSLMGDFRFWTYKSADAIATVRFTGYISNAKDMGMRVDDLVLVVDTTNHLLHWCYVISISATTGAGDLTDGLAITATDTD